MFKIFNRILLTALLLLPLAVHAESITPNLKFNGFITAMAGTLNNEQVGDYIPDYFGYPGLTQNSVNMGLDSLIGLQFDYQVNEQINIVTQLAAKGVNNYDVNAEWAYIGYQVNDQVRVRAGHFALPIFMYSETIHVGQSYPWARLPVEVYKGVPVSTFDGADLLFRMPLGDWHADAQLLVGSSYTTLFRTDNAKGINLSLANTNLLIRSGFITSNVTVNRLSGSFPGCPACTIKESDNSFANAGFQYDDNRFFFAGEIARLRVDGWVKDWDGGYLSAGFYVGKSLPYVIWSKTNALNNKCATVALCEWQREYKEQSTLAIGIKHSINNHVSLKAQVDRVYHFNGTYGYLNPPAPLPVPPAPALPVPSNFYVFTAGITAAF